MTRPLLVALTAASFVLAARADDLAPPTGLQTWLEGEPADVVTATRGPALVLMGGGADVDAAFEWWKEPLQGGDVVILRTSGEDGYNAYLHAAIGGCDSVETLLVRTRAQADDAWVVSRLDQAEAIFIAGGDQATYLRAWKDTQLENALHRAWRRGCVLGGTSAGAAVLGELSYAAYDGTVRSRTVLDDPYAPTVTLERGFLSLPVLEDVLVDTHVGERHREGRLVGFLARLQSDGWSRRPLGIGIDERTALVVDRRGVGTVIGRGKVTLIRPGPDLPEQCLPEAPLLIRGLEVFTLRAGDTVRLPSGETSVKPARMRVHDSELVPDTPRAAGG